MIQLIPDELMFFDKQTGVLPVYETFSEKLLAIYCDDFRCCIHESEPKAEIEHLDDCEK